MGDAKSHMMMRKSIHRTVLDGPLQGSQRMKLPFKPTPKNPMIVSASEIGSFLRCRLQWNWRHRVGLESTKMAAPRAIGILFHDGKDHWYREPSKKRTPELMDRIARSVIKAASFPVEPKDKELTRAMLVGYASWVLANHDKSDRAIGKRKVNPEFEFSLPLVEDGSILVRGKIDEWFKPTIFRNTIALEETKTKNAIEFDMLDLNAQLTTYIWALSEKFPQYDEYQAFRTVARRQMPGPRVKAPLFGRSDAVVRDPDDLKMWVKDTRRIVRDMMDAAIYPTPTDRCKWDCDFYNLCLVRSNKQDLTDVIHSEFITK